MDTILAHSDVPQNHNACRNATERVTKSNVPRLCPWNSAHSQTNPNACKPAYFDQRVGTVTPLCENAPHILTACANRATRHTRRRACRQGSSSPPRSPAAKSCLDVGIIKDHECPKCSSTVAMIGLRSTADVSLAHHCRSTHPKTSLTTLLAGSNILASFAISSDRHHLPLTL